MISLRQTFDSRRRRLENPILVGGSSVTSSLLIILAVSTLAGAKVLSEDHLSVETVAAQGSSSSPNQVPFQTVAKGFHSGIRESLQTVARNQTEWQALWQKHASIQSNTPTPPAIDFSNELVVAILLGEKPTGGYDIEIISAERNDGTLTFLFNQREPRPGGMQIQAFTQPFHIVRIATTGSEKIVFRRLP